MVNVTRIDRKSAVLSPSSLACLADIPAVNLTSGCAHDCLYCYARGYSVFPGENKVVVYKNTLEKLKKELAHRRTKPQAVYFSSSSDIFQPVPEVIELGYSVLEFLLTSGIGIAILTKGFIPDETFKLLLTYPKRVRMQIGIITADDTLRSIYEPNAASISTRLEQMTKLVQGGIVTEARVIPILPGITDKSGSIDRLLSIIASTGVKRVAISTLFLRPAITASLKRCIVDHITLENLLGHYKSEKRLAVHAENSSVIPLSRLKREEVYTHFRHVAKKYALDLSICGCMNPDIGGVCNITGEWPAYDTQSSMFK
jgi:DNA repair photolyase